MAKSADEIEVGNRVEDVSRYSTRGLRHGTVIEIRWDGITVQWDAWQDDEDFIGIRVETADADEISVMPTLTLRPVRDTAGRRIGIYDVHHAETRLGSVDKGDSGWIARSNGRSWGPFPTRREAVAEVWIEREAV